ncbi:pyridoxamine 5'-phosphate oxidase family protein [Pelagicoccus sp. SDUM812003]|uniref:HugZ family pyridoxamine 5'-phosphate oxidase n=1 Tax=Pelagicoccus sp. SDUM812003 TaxID=3041267 RepID=UPI00280CE806|nr:pyridoxamine 5'-phosphate oxidase family protein [Pelagicoccus sp. SDUM812003]MDQ8203245.1 pyridoxamine 5'-phosphate oxidase family protein [Pelagicoccus sp. SDUM812003]
MDTDEEKEFEWAAKEMEALLQRVRCCQLATVSSSGSPLASYAPVFVDEERRFYVFVSAIAKHYGHLKRSGKASLSMIDDESASENLFARKRLTVDCDVALVERDSEAWLEGTAGLQRRGGETMGYLKELSDFDLFRLRASEGRLVLGFGKAYRVSGERLETIAYLGAGGHRSKNSSK